MAAAAAVARTTARVAYDVAKGRTEQRARPTEGNVNLRLFEPAVVNAKQAYEAWDNANINYIAKAALDDAARTEEIRQGNILADEHDVWMLGIEDIVDRVKAADQPPPAIPLTDAQKAARVKITMKAKEDAVGAQVALLENSCGEITDGISELQLESIGGRHWWQGGDRENETGGNVD